jgi:formylglycine-generating enzyme required for sulfatase activity
MGSPAGENCRESVLPAKEQAHDVTLTRDFEITATEVVQEVFSTVMGYDPWASSSCGAACPARNMSWYEAAAFCNQLSHIRGYVPCYECSGDGPQTDCKVAAPYAGAKFYTCPGYRLPTEAEWEYAARAGSNTALALGDLTNCTGKDSVAELSAWYKGNSTGPRPVAQKAPNAWALYDMHGNLWEWVHDWQKVDLGSAAVTDPWGPASGQERGLRGGAFLDEPQLIRSATRHTSRPQNAYTGTGFRYVRTTR